jgi:hypothetical protein
MPIRTNRGRAAVYRRLWGWPMRSPTHLVVLLVVIAVLILAISIVVPQLTGSDRGGSGAVAETTEQTTSGNAQAPGATPGTPSSAQGSDTTALPTRITSVPRSPTPAEPAPEALDVAREWAEAWVNHPEGTTSEEWLEGLKPYTDEEYMVELATVDPANVPSTEVTGDPEATESFTNSLTVSLPTDGVTLSIKLIATPDGWRVISYEEARR